MKGRQWVMVGALAAALIGAVLVFALDNENATVTGIELQPLGGVLLAAGLLVVVGTAITGMSGGGGGPVAPNPANSSDAGSIRAIGGLIAVVCGTVLVASLAAFTITRLGSKEADSAVAVASSAFGVISAVVGAYLGIKITADTSAKAGEEAKHAAIVKHEAEAAQQKSAGMSEKLEELAAEEKLPVGVADEVKEAGAEAEVAARTVGPPRGGGAAA